MSEDNAKRPGTPGMAVAPHGMAGVEAKAAKGDTDYMSDARAAITRDRNPFAAAILYMTIAFVVLGLIWAANSRLDEVAVGTGRVIPSKQVQVIQNLEGGILSELSVKEGQVVEKDQMLLRIDDTRFTSSFREAKAKRLSLLATIARLTAESQGGAPQFPAEVLKDAPQFVKNEQQLHATRRHALESTLEGLRRSQQLAKQELEMSEPLLAKGAISEVEILRLRRQLNEVQTNIDERRNRFRAEANEELNKAKNELAGLDESTVAMVDRVNRTLVRSPVRGIVKKLFFTTLGSVIQPGATILEVVPLEDSLLIEAQVRPDDIAFIHPGQYAMVKVTAYDFSIYGGLPGKVELVSADALVDDKKGVSYYKVLVRTQSSNLQFKERQLPIIPGMTATVDILTGHKTVMQYLLKPVLRARESAMRER